MKHRTFNIQRSTPNIQRNARRGLGCWALNVECWMFLLLLSGCAVGPNFQRPAAPGVSGYTTITLTTTSSVTNVFGGEAQRFVTGADISGDWWTLFHSQPLNDLISLALTNNPDLQSAQAVLTVARENMLAGKGAFYPSVSASFSASRNKTSEEIAPVPNANEFYYSLFTPQVSVSYVPDVFGLNRRTVESLKAQEEAARFQLVATHITLSANVVLAAIQEASLRAQIDATRQLVAINANMVQVMQQQFAKGAATRLDLAAQESQLAQNEAALPPLLKQLAQQRDALAVLAGKFPSENLPERFALSDLQLPEDLPVTLPSQLVEQRPDVRLAEENLHAASAQVGIAIANRLPNITLTANAGTMALAAGKIFAGGEGFWDLGAGVAAPIFEGGTLLHRERAAKAAYIQATEQYRSTVLTAFQNVADTLNVLQQDADALNSAAKAANAAKIALDLSRQKIRTGSDTAPLDLLNAEQTYQQAELNFVQAQANRYADTAALFQALGGGWWHRADLPQK
jgi:NodT family efflux transporter outer membrane factor (OMF) lipoprotein